MGTRVTRLLSLRYAIAGLVTIATATVLLHGLNPLLAHPSKTEAAETVFGDLLRYETLHGEPHVVFRHNDRIYFDELRRDYKYLLVKRSAGWLMTGKWYYLPETDALASVGVARCTGILGEVCDKSTELFGQINSPEITTLEVEYGGEWHRFAVEEPGYAVRLDGFERAPSGYRWLDSNGNVVHEQGYVAPLVPGR